MPRFKLDIEYEGTRYKGWQVQKGTKTVQGEFFTACKEIFGDVPFEFYGSGRTDAGVHAIGQVAHLDVATSLKPEIIVQRFNDVLPHDITVLHAQRVDPQFHARFSAVTRSYVYVISRKRTAFAKPFVWWVRDYLDVEEMRDAAKAFKGMRDFRSFSDDTPEEKSTKVQLDWVDIHEDGNLIFIHIVGSHFLWKMVRRMVGVLVEVGRGNMTEGDIQNFLSRDSNEPAKYTAPPSGLFLEQVYYNLDDVQRNFKHFLYI